MLSTARFIIHCSTAPNLLTMLDLSQSGTEHHRSSIPGKSESRQQIVCYLRFYGGRKIISNIAE